MNVKRKIKSRQSVGRQKGTKMKLDEVVAQSETCAQSYKASTSENYHSRVIFTSKLLIFTTLKINFYRRAL